jgi:esterase
MIPAIAYREFHPTGQSAVSSGRITSGDTTQVLLHHTERGEGKPLILLHGLFGSGANLGMVSRGLAGSYRVLSPDLRNHGRSPHAEPMDYHAMAADVAAFMDHMEIAQSAICGHSMGGKVAMQMALDYPDRVLRLVVADIAPVEYPPGHRDVFAGLAAVEAARPPGRREADTVLADHVAEPGVRAFLLKSWQRDDLGNWGWLLDRPALVRNYAALGKANSGPAWNGPTLFLKGELSNYIQTRHQVATLALFPQAQLKVIEQTGHWLHAEKPALFNALVLRFLAQDD